MELYVYIHTFITYVYIHIYTCTYIYVYVCNITRNNLYLIHCSYTYILGYPHHDAKVEIKSCRGAIYSECVSFVHVCMYVAILLATCFLTVYVDPYFPF